MLPVECYDRNLFALLYILFIYSLTYLYLRRMLGSIAIVLFAFFFLIRSIIRYDRSIRSVCFLMFQAYVDLVKAWGWKSFTIIYENNEGLVRLQELLKAHGPSEFPITVRQLSEGSEYRWVLRISKPSRNIIVPLFPPPFNFYVHSLFYLEKRTEWHVRTIDRSIRSFDRSNFSTVKWEEGKEISVIFESLVLSLSFFISFFLFRFPHKYTNFWFIKGYARDVHFFFLFSVHRRYEFDFESVKS